MIAAVLAPPAGAPAALVSVGPVTALELGPLALLDLVGLDVSEAIGETIGESIPPHLRKLIAEGSLGRKSGAGFHAYR